MSQRLFDLNIEDVLEHWEPHHAVREVIANALDESLLTATPEPVIRSGKPSSWTVRDFGRGLQVHHFTMNENQEKLGASGGVIGKFGVGLKDALATFHRHGVEVQLASSHGTFRLVEARKHSFEDITTLHIAYSPGRAIDQGTEVRLEGLSAEDMGRARDLFLRYSSERVIEETSYGEILSPSGTGGRVYINGVLANEEERFRFGYNITNLTASMRKRLNRERVNIGRTTYSDRVKTILKVATSEEVLDALADEVPKRATGDQCEEIDWIDIAQIALNRLSQRANVTLLTEEDLSHEPQLLERVKEAGQQVVVITNHQRERLEFQMEEGGPRVRTATEFWQEYEDSFRYNFVDTENLLPRERATLAKANAILSLAGVKIDVPVRVSSTMQHREWGQTRGVWTGSEIIILRRILASTEEFAAVLLHEAAHAVSGADDSTRAFESTLTEFLGRVVASALPGSNPSREHEIVEAQPRSRQPISEPEVDLGTQLNSPSVEGRGAESPPADLDEHVFVDGVCVRCGKQEYLAGRFGWHCR